jgi:hypothetical protein
MDVLHLDLIMLESLYYTCSGSRGFHSLLSASVVLIRLRARMRAVHSSGLISTGRLTIQKSFSYFKGAGIEKVIFPQLVATSDVLMQLSFSLRNARRCSCDSFFL